jgi:hypothetical protein
MIARTSNNAPAPNRRPRLPLGIRRGFEYLFCARPSSPAAAGETQRWPTHLMRTLLIALLLLPLSLVADEVRIAVGMNYGRAVSMIKKHGGVDITPDQAVVGPNGEFPLTGIYWAFGKYDAIIALSRKDAKIGGISFWTKKDFNESKSHRVKSEQSIQALKLDTKTGKVSVEKKKRRADQRLETTPGSAFRSASRLTSWDRRVSTRRWADLGTTRK